MSTPTQDLILELLGARWRLGYERWPLSTRHRSALVSLETAGLVTFERGFEPRTLNARLTEKGRKAAMLDGHQTPAGQLVNDALFLLRNGERAPGGNETWAEWVSRAEPFLRRQP